MPSEIVPVDKIAPVFWNAFQVYATITIPVFWVQCLRAPYRQLFFECCSSKGRLFKRMQTRAVDTLRRQGEKRRHLFSRSLFKRRTFDGKCVIFWLENSPRSCCMHREKHFYFKMLITFEPNVAQRSVASQNDHKSKACLPEASNTAFTMYRRLKRRLRRLYEAPF